jgi:hypothetical protein
LQSNPAKAGLQEALIFLMAYKDSENRQAADGMPLA